MGGRVVERGVGVLQEEEGQTVRIMINHSGLAGERAGCRAGFRAGGQDQKTCIRIIVSGWAGFLVGVLYSKNSQ